MQNATQVEKTDLERILTEDGVFLTYVRPALSEAESGIRFIEFLGVFQEDYLACTGVWEGVEERSFWVPLNTFNIGDIVKMASYWDQDAILISRPSEDKSTLLGKEMVHLGKIQEVSKEYAESSQGYTRFFQDGEFHYLAII